MKDVRGDSVKRQLIADHGIEIDNVRSIVGFLISSEIRCLKKSLNRADDVFADPIIEESATDSLHLENKELFSNNPDMVVTIGFKPGVTDNPGKAALDGFRTIFPNAGDDARVSTYLTYTFEGVPEGVEVEWLAKQLHNGLIERALYSLKGEEYPVIEYAPITPSDYAPPAVVDLEVSDEELMKLIRRRITRSKFRRDANHSSTLQRPGNKGKKSGVRASRKRTYRCRIRMLSSNLVRALQAQNFRSTHSPRRYRNR